MALVWVKEMVDPNFGPDETYMTQLEPESDGANSECYLKTYST